MNATDVISFWQLPYVPRTADAATIRAVPWQTLDPVNKSHIPQALPRLAKPRRQSISLGKCSPGGH